MSKDDDKRLYQRVKTVAKSAIKDTDVRFCQGSMEFLNQLTNEFIEMMALASLDKSERSKQYIDSEGVISALKFLGFDSVADQLPDFSEFAEDMQKIN